MRILIIGATGTIGQAVTAALADRHDVIRVGHRSGEFQVDIASPASIERLFQQVGTVDAIVSVAGAGVFKPLAELTEADFHLGLSNKLMGQINLVRLGLPYLADGGSITLTSGILAHAPTPGSAALAPVSAGVEAFARAAALEMPSGIRLQVVSPPWITETLEAHGMDASGGTPAAVAARAYVDSLEPSRCCGRTRG